MSAELERSIKEAAEASVPNAVAISYTEMQHNGGGPICALVAADDFSRGAQRLIGLWEDARLELLAVDRRLFEADVRDSALLEAAAVRLLLPYVALKGGGYLARWERLYKRRKIQESLAGLAMEHPELSSELLVDPRYFVHDSLLRLSHLLPRAFELLGDLDEGGSELLGGFTEALRELESEGTVRIIEGLVSVDRGFVDEVLRRGFSAPDQLTRVQRQLQGLLKLGLRGAVDLFRPPSLSVVEDLVSTAVGVQNLPRPDRFLHFPTATGIAPMSEATSIDEFLSRLRPPGRAGKTRLRRFGGVLNEVYMLTYAVDGETRRAIMKRYPNWVSLKWAPIALWTLGTKNFAVQGRSRMERECATSSLLGRSGIPVPKILLTSFEDRLLVREYVEGESLADIVKAAIQGGPNGHGDLLRRAGGTVAAVHGAGATLGDCKPENFVVAAGGEPFIVDLEQGTRGGDETWDLAEFLYFSGHYAGPFAPLHEVVEVARCFIEGYVAGGGDRRSAAEAARLRYTKVFTPIALPTVISAIAQTCREEAGFKGGR
ncbi:hypothetical protein AC482_01290 [miscellaneous Crenarchaeota group-15 archaeon DG-45]|uniref:Protein kinase domain-containing protein n=1 Tax=miscellaneous Crenarchaeota group-15 archaeon DG-45 TaxID=1685127 RepID=A0A0M0BRR3_9ARCH|nr:MAG: hypothetical protein AC482_01290 [miscellaneous Crenarchaeota group-15 archaeon DG-45]